MFIQEIVPKSYFLVSSQLFVDKKKQNNNKIKECGTYIPFSDVNNNVSLQEIVFFCTIPSFTHHSCNICFCFNAKKKGGIFVLL